MDKAAIYFRNNNITMFIAILLVAVCMPCLAAAQQFTNSSNSWMTVPNIPAMTQSANSSECNIHNKGTKLKNCPTGRRFDISAKCIAEQNAGSGKCLNTMPVDGAVDRVPEDVCFRGSGTSNNSNARNHNGMDYAATTSAKVLAAADGWVTRRVDVSNGGKTITMVHTRSGGGTSPKTDTYTTQYLHLSSFIYSGGVCAGALNNSCWVKKDTPLGYVGNTGCGNCGNHLHFEMKDSSGNYIDPMCDDIQGLCGGTAMNLTSCRQGCEGREDECRHSWTPVDGETPANAATGTGGAGSDYEVKNAASKKVQCSLESYRESLSSCFFCNPFMILFNTASEIADNAFNTFAPWVMNVVIVAMALWVALKVILFVSAMEVKDPRVMIKELLSQGFVVLVVVVILNTELQTFMNMAIEPIFSTGFKLARLTMNGLECTNDYGIAENGGLPASMGNDIVCTVKSIQDYIVDIMAVGSLLICIAWFKESLWGIPLFLHWGYFLSGLGVWIGAILLLLVYPFLLIDVMLQLCIAVALIPAAIGCYAFKITRKYVGKIFETIMNAMFTFVFLTIIIFMVTAQLNESLKDLVDPLSRADDTTPWRNVLNTVLWSGEMFLRILFISLLGVSVMGSVKDFTGMFAKGGISIKPIGSPVGGMAASAGKALAKGVGKTAVKIAKPHALKLGGGIKFAIQKFKNDYWEKKIAASGGQINRKSWIRRRNITRDVVYENGKRVIVKTQVTAKKGKIIQTRNDGYIKHITVRTKLGMVQERSELIKGAGSYLVKKNGEVMKKHIQQIAGNSANDVKAQEAILRALVDELMPGIHAAKFINKAYMDGSRTSGFKEDDDGVETFEIVQNNVDAKGNKTKQILSMRFIGDRVMIRAKTISANGEVEEYATNGMKNMVATYKQDANGNVIGDRKPAFSFTPYYRERDGQPPISKTGKVSKYASGHNIGYREEDDNATKHQFMHGGGNINIPGFRR